MPEEVYNPQPQSNPPSNLSLLDIIKAFSSQTGIEYSTRLTNVNDLLSDNIEPLFENIQGDPYSNEELGEILTYLVREVLLNKKEIMIAKHLIALVTFELIYQGIELNDKELMQNINTYLKYK